MCIHLCFENIVKELKTHCDELRIECQLIDQKKIELLTFLIQKYTTELILKKDSFLYRPGFNAEENPADLKKVFDFLYEQAKWFFRPAKNDRSTLPVRSLHSKPRSEYQDEKWRTFAPIVDSLRIECEIYRKLLLERFGKIMIPTGYRLDYRYEFGGNSQSLQEGRIAISVALVIDENYKKPRKKIAKNRSSKIQGEIDKYHKIQQFNNLLNHEDNLPHERVMNFYREFQKPTTQQTLTRDFDTDVVRFIKNVWHILTWGVVSRLTKGTFSFWKAKDQVIAERMTDILKPVEPPPPIPEVNSENEITMLPSARIFMSA